MGASKLQKRKQQIGALYPWDDWLNRKRFVLRRGIHYGCSPEGMAQQVRNAALRKGRRVSITTVGDVLVCIVRENH